MSVATLNGAASSSLSARLELVPVYFDTELIASPAGNPVYTPALVADLVESFRQHAQLSPGWVCPSPDLPEKQRLCLEGNRRVAAARLLGLDFWAFDLGRFVPEEERIVLTFQHNYSRRIMTRDELAERAARFIEITGCSAADASKLLNVSPATLSRAFGERRIPARLQSKAGELRLSIRSLIAALPVDQMEQAITFASSPDSSGRKPTRDAVTAYIAMLKKGGRPKSGKPKTISLHMNGRTVTLTYSDTDTAASVSEDFLAIIAKVRKKGVDVAPDGWPFLFS